MFPYRHHEPVLLLLLILEMVVVVSSILADFVPAVLDVLIHLASSACRAVIIVCRAVTVSRSNVPRGSLRYFKSRGVV